MSSKIKIEIKCCRKYDSDSSVLTIELEVNVFEEQIDPVRVVDATLAAVLETVTQTRVMMVATVMMMVPPRD